MPLKELKPDSVALLMPCGGDMDPRAVQSVIAMTARSANEGHTFQHIGVTSRMLIQTARNVLAKGFLNTECEWSMWIDSDMTFEPRTVKVLMQYAKQLSAKMVCGIYYQRVGDHKPVAWQRTVESKDGQISRTCADKYSAQFVYPSKLAGLPFKLDVTGFGCVLIHRSVFEAMDYPYFRFDYYEHNGVIKEASEDFYFFTKARELGIALWAVPELRLGHVGESPIITHKDMKMPSDPVEIKTELAKEAVK